MGLDAKDFDASGTARLRGRWGFDAFEGPEYLVQFPQGGAWRQADDAQRLIVGRDNELRLTGAAPACVESVTLQMPGGRSQPATWKVADAGTIAVDMPLAGVKAGEVQIAIKPFGADKPVVVTSRAYAEASRIDALLLHAGDERAMLTGLRLDQIASVSLESVVFRPGDLSRAGDVDTLQLIAEVPEKARTMARGQGGTAQVTLRDGRSVALRATVAAARPAAMLIGRSLDHKDPRPPLPIALEGQDLLPDDARLTVSIQLADGQRFGPRDMVEVATVEEGSVARLTVGNGLQLESARIAIANVDPASLGASAFGPLRYRVVQPDAAGDWQPLATLVRLPVIQSVTCSGADACRLTGRNLFLIGALAANRAFDTAVPVPGGFTGSTIDLPPLPDKKLYLQLRDAPGDIQAVSFSGS